VDTIAELLDAIGAEDEQAIEAWRSRHGDGERAWRECPDAGALLAMAYRTVPDEVIVAAAVACVREALPLVDGAERERCAEVLDLADRWSEGQADAHDLQQAALELDNWAGDLDQPVLVAQVGQAAACAADGARAPRAVQMAARALGYAAIGVTPSMSRSEFVSARLYLSDADQQAFECALGRLVHVVHPRVPRPSLDAVRARRLG
jgi:hypothetical protein